ncbi:hypothetical protein [Yinghuangia soli]|uniref:Uncharacterized protein n=1 Tax=Yinghuangia soli TaxID=2908204 RepID=A0AA41Q617_9ACTN|nr:hypothetical protein [Yinghuangia soli]MCF2532255.1 hypothetical protein [Yinghuangia soli]
MARKVPDGPAWVTRRPARSGATGDGKGGTRVLLGGDTLRYSDDRGTTFHPGSVEVPDGPWSVDAYSKDDDDGFRTIKYRTGRAWDGWDQDPYVPAPGTDTEGPWNITAFAQHDGVLFAAMAGGGDMDRIRRGEINFRPRRQGVLRSLDHGTTWHDHSGNLPDLGVTALAVGTASGHLYAGLDGGSVHRLAL